MNNDRFKFRVWSEYLKKYLSKERGDGVIAIRAEDARLCMFYRDAKCDYPLRDDCIIEQCTGLKDIEGNLIFEGDIIKVSYGIPPTFDIVTIEWVEDEELDRVQVGGWWMRNHKKDGCESILCKSYENSITIIGNIHEEKK